MISVLMVAAGQVWAAYGKFPPPVAPYSTKSLNTARVKMPIIFPLIGGSNYSDDFNAPRSGHRHTGIDIKAPKMTPIVAPFKGRFGYKVHSFWIYGDYGWKCLGTHLNDDTPGTNDGKNNFDFMFAPNLNFGDHVEAGQLIGYVGNSGDATGPHLHFEMYSPVGIRDPFPSLQHAMHINMPTRVIRNLNEKPDHKEERYEVCKRNWIHLGGSFYGILLAKQYDTGRVITVKHPSFVTFSFPQDLVEKLDSDSWPTNRPASIYFRREGEKVVVTKVVQPDN
jgi:murein DD-endopeptidase MepM/ murein hydrolase activator NlpD